MARLGRWYLVVCLVSLAAAGCGMQPPERGTGPGGRRQVLALSPQQELEVGREAYAKVIDEYRDRIIPTDDPRVIRARHILSRIVQAARIEPLQREINLQHVRDYYFEWEVNLVRDDKVNAFCLPAGKIILYTEILRVAQGDDELATVLSHEASHALAHHASERIAAERGASARNILGKLANSRQQEAEADHIGVFLMTFAGYDPDAAVRFWQRMESLGRGGSRPEILSDHPSDATRIQLLQKWAPAARAARHAYDQGNISPAPSR